MEHIIYSPEKLDLGCGRRKEKGFFGVDKRAMIQEDRGQGGVDLVWDMENRPWPLSDNCARIVIAHQVVEHLTDLVGWVRELWRVCRPDAFVEITTPYAGNVDAWSSPTHVRPYTRRTWFYFEPEYVDSFSDYGLEGRLWRVVIAVERSDGNVWAVLRPIKNEAAMLRWRQIRKPEKGSTVETDPEEERWKKRRNEMLGGSSRR